jgi:hypothetical protein
MCHALDHARGQPNRYDLAVALAIATNLHQFRCEPERVASLAQERIELRREQRIAQWLAKHHLVRAGHRQWRGTMPTGYANCTRA